MSKHILIIDDEELIIKSLSMFLKSAGFTVTVARSGSEAMRAVKKNSFDLIICDVRMPGLDGVETIKQIRDLLAETKRKPTPEVFITGYADMEKYQEAMKLKVADYLYKPFDNEQLMQVVKRAIG